MYAAFRRLGYAKSCSGFALCTIFLRHIFAVAGTLRVPLSQQQKRHLPPERYMPFALNLVKKNQKTRKTS
jgi:hypothetical protein